MAHNRVTLNIKNQQVHDAAAKLARLQGTTITQAVLNALNAELQRSQRRLTVEEEISRMEMASRRVAALPLLDSRSDDEILGYGAEGYLVGD